ncbi:High affinity potassium transporter [Spathaspora sp. JA1]|nr:High affinity potassium transporter [Spathaspora sp. JA1]
MSTSSIKKTIPESDLVDQNDNYSVNTVDDDNHSVYSAGSFDEEEEIQSVGTDEKIAPVRKQPWRVILMLSFSSLGAIYGDLGTSPLYTLNSIKYKSLPPNKDDVYGAVSVIFYLFTIIVIVKYVFIVLVIGDNNGEGGQVAIYAKIARHLNIGPKGVQIPGGSNEISDLQLLSRQDTTASASSNNSTTSRINQIKQHPTMIKIVQMFILGACFIGCSLVISDGLLTPTASILSAVGGIQVAQPSFTNVLAVSEVILIVLFTIQQFGSNKISFTFAPIIFIWMIGLIICGIYNIVKYHPGIFAALSPYYAIKILKEGGIDVFGGAMLAITGTEAMFADLGHFGRLPIQLTLGGFVYPALILCYLGQAAYLIEHPQAYTNPFFLSIPGGTSGGVYWVMFVLATLATIIASQALILSVFSILGQLINLDCFPKLKITHVSSKYHGKVYIGVINWILMVGVMLTMAGFQNSNNTTAAYGLGITLDLFVTSTLIIICMFYVYNWNIIWPILYCSIFIPLELCLIIANMKKVPHGAWFPIMISGLLTSFLLVWRWCRSRKVQQEFQSKIKIGELYPYFNKPRITTLDLNNKDSSQDEIDQTFGKLDVNTTRFGHTSSLVKTEGLGVMYVDSLLTNSPNTLPQLYGKLVSTFVSIPNNFVFCGIRVLSLPYIGEEERILMAPMKLPGHYKCVLRFGYMEDIKVDKELMMVIMKNIPVLSNLNDEQLEKYPIIHIFENDLIRSHEYQPINNRVKNMFKKIGWFFRMMTINHFYSPLNSLTQEYGRFLKVEDEVEEREKKIFIGGIARM